MPAITELFRSDSDRIIGSLRWVNLQEDLPRPRLTQAEFAIEAAAHEHAEEAALVPRDVLPQADELAQAAVERARRVVGARLGRLWKQDGESFAGRRPAPGAGFVFESADDFLEEISVVAVRSPSS